MFSDQLSKHIPVIEKHLLGEGIDKSSLSPRTDAPEKMVVHLTQTHSPKEFRETCLKIGIKEDDVGDLWTNRVVDCLESDCSPQTKQLFIEGYQTANKIMFTEKDPSKGEEAQKLSGKLDLSFTTLSTFVTSNSDYLQHLGGFGLLQLTTSDLMGLSKKDLRTYLFRATLAYSSEEVLPLLRKHFDNMRQENSAYTFESQILSKLTLGQLQALPSNVQEVTSDQNYFLQLFKREFIHNIKQQFPQPANQLSTKERLQKYEMLLNAIRYVEGLNNELLRTPICLLTLEALRIESLLKIANHELLIRYLQNPLTNSDCFSESYQQQLNHRKHVATSTNFWSQGLSIIFSPYEEKTVIQNQLNIILEDQESSNTSVTSVLSQFFGQMFIERTWEKIARARGTDIPAVDSRLSATQLDDLRKEKKLILLDTNPTFFKVSNEVVLKIKVKNIPQVVADVYEISTENHCLTSTEAISSTVNLEFLVPNFTITKAIQCADPFKESILDWSFSGILANRPSVYVIDFRSEQMASRAIIRRGTIRTQQKITLAGLQLQFFSQENETLSDLVVWQNDQRLKIKDTHTIPFGSTVQRVSLVVCHNEYAERVQVTVPKEDYALSVKTIYDEEGFMANSKVKVLLQAKLTIAGNLISLTSLRNSRIGITITSFKSTNFIKFENVEWSSKDDYLVEFQVLEQPQEILIEVKAEAERYNDKNQALETAQCIRFSEPTDTYAQFFLSRDDRDYVLLLLGRNGEPIANYRVFLKLDSILFAKTLEAEVQTNERGEILLGPLTYIKKLKANIYKWMDRRQLEVEGKWKLERKAQTDYPKEVSVKVDEDVSFPLPVQFQLERHARLTKVSQSGQPISDETRILRVEDHRLTFRLLQKGKYDLAFPSIPQTIRIVAEVSKPKQASTRQAHRLVGLGRPQYSETEAGCAVEIPLTIPENIKPEQLESLKVHVISSAFISKSNLIDAFRSTIAATSERADENLNKRISTCSYLNDKRLSDEHCYVLNRAGEEKYIGNNLEKPCLLLKRTYIKETSFQVEKLEDEKAFEPIEEKKNETSKNQKDKDKKKKKKMCGKEDESMLHQISPSNKFLVHSCRITQNIHERTIKFVVPNYHRNCRIIVSSPFLFLQTSLGFPQKPLPTKDLKNEGCSQDTDKTGLGVVRKVHQVPSGQSLSLPLSSVWVVIDGNKLFDYCDRKRRGYHEELKWRWILDWHESTDEKKLELYDKYYCHELNIFIRYQDSAFFDKYILAFLRNKIQKSVIDLCLTRDGEVARHVDPYRLTQLNQLEKCLLVDCFVQLGNVSAAQGILNLLRREVKQQQHTVELFKVRFDSVMNNAELDRKCRSDRGGGGGEHGGRRSDSQRGEDFQFQELPEGIPRQTVEKMMFDMRSKGKPANQDEDYEKQQKLYNFLRTLYKPGFKPIEKTKEYYEAGYHANQYHRIGWASFEQSSFWLELAEHFMAKESVPFLSREFIYLKEEMECATMLGVLGLASRARYSTIVSDRQVTIKAENNIFVLSKETKQLPFVPQYGVLVQQRVYEAKNGFMREEDGTKVPKPMLKYNNSVLYKLETVVINTSVSRLDIEAIISIPRGAIALDGRESVVSIGQVIEGYRVTQYHSQFYFPETGEFTMDPCSVSRNGVVIAKAERLAPFVVKKYIRITQEKMCEQDIKRMTVDELIASLNKQDRELIDVLRGASYLLRDLLIYSKVMQALRATQIFNQFVWKYAFLHKQVPAILQYIRSESSSRSKFDFVFEYSPLSPSRIHRFMDQGKKTILNQEFRETYHKFILRMLVQKGMRNNPGYQLVFVYYLLLQDRVPEAEQLFKRVKVPPENDKDTTFPQLQYDLIACYLDMCTGQPNFHYARKISDKHKDHPIPTWRNRFREFYNLLNTYDGETYVEAVEHIDQEIKLLDRGQSLNILLPAHSQLRLDLVAVNLELMFSNSPFNLCKVFSTIRPFNSLYLQSNDKVIEQIVKRPAKSFDILVRPVDISQGKRTAQIPPFLWANPSVKVKILTEEGLAFVYVQGKIQAGAYFKVYGQQGSECRFLKDGYTDIRGAFRYIPYNSEQISRFAILCVTSHGGVAKIASKPGTVGSVP